LIDKVRLRLAHGVKSEGNFVPVRPRKKHCQK
jgi:hypothetical protein